MENPLIIPLLKDNYAYLLSYENQAIVIDPSDGPPIINILEKHSLSLTHILLTHHHQDHIAGAEKLKEKTGSLIFGPGDSRIPFLDRSLTDNGLFEIGPYFFKTLFTPGHTRSHIVYFLEKEKILFSGDTLFSMGCGRVFEGSYKEMWDSLKKIRNLPKDTKIFPGHEYTYQNISFALSLDPKNLELNQALKRIESLRKNRKSSIPSTLEWEVKNNPFLRVDDDKFKEMIQMKGDTDTHVFQKLRELKDAF